MEKSIGNSDLIRKFIDKEPFSEEERRIFKNRYENDPSFVEEFESEVEMVSMFAAVLKIKVARRKK